MSRVILDFAADPAAVPPVPATRLRFCEPSAIVVASSIAEVPAALRRVEAAARRGRWAAGFVGYEAAPAFDRALVTRPADGPAPLLWFGIYDEPDALPRPLHADATPLDWTTGTSRERYDAAIADVRSRIAAGDVYQVNYTLRFLAACDLDPLALHDALVARGHGGYAALVETDDWAIVSASPELFFDVRATPDGARRIITRPMKGTERRGRWLDEDRTAVARLDASAKDRAENLMIVDLLRNDIGRVARFGSVRVPRLFDIETYPTVHQMTSTVTATLRDDVTLSDIFAAMFPCGSVTGAPKVTAMRTIARLEDAPRGPYCGAVGVVRPDGSATFNVAIRTLLLDRRAARACYGAGGGITWDSRAAAEYDEIRAKAALLADALPAFELIETMRCDAGSIPRLQLHLQRLAASAAYWGFDTRTAEHARAALARLAARLRHGSWRVRLTATPDAHIRTTHTPLAGDEAALHDAAAPLTVALARRAICRDDRLLCHKTTARAAYDERRADRVDAFDVLLFNGAGEVTEFTTGNVVAEIDGRLLTPPRTCGLLGGTMRRQLLEAGAIEEAVISLQNVRSAHRLWHINSVGGCRRVALI